MDDRFVKKLNVFWAGVTNDKREIRIEELCELQMQILNYVDAVCCKHEIKYTLSDVTLLGAIRHSCPRVVV